MKLEGRVHISSHAEDRFRELIPMFAVADTKDIRRVMVAMYFSGCVWGGGQSCDDFFIRTKHRDSNIEVVFVIAPEEDVRMIKTVLPLEYAMANVNVRTSKTGTKPHPKQITKMLKQKEFFDDNPDENDSKKRYKRKSKKTKYNKKYDDEYFI